MEERRTMIWKMVLLSVGLLVIGACAPPAKLVTITSDPNMATIYINGEETGITTLRKELLFDIFYQHDVVAKKEGYEDGKTVIRYDPFDRTDYHIELEKTEAVSITLVDVQPTATAQGVKLAVTRRRTLAYFEVIERSPNVKSVTRITNNEEKALQIGPPVLSPVEDVLVYALITVEEGGTSYSNIWKTTIGSFGKTRVTYGKRLDLFPAFTPDGKYLVFSSNRTSRNATLWRINIGGGGGITNITSTLAEDYSPSILPDGSIIAYASNPPEAEEPQIWTINMSGTLPTQLREGKAPQVSPDGERILFVRTQGVNEPNQIWVMNMDGGAETQLTQNMDYDALNPKWSPDGQWIVFSSNEGLDSKGRRNYDIWLMDADGSKKTQLTTNGSRDDTPCWDHTGTSIYFRSNRGGNWNIWRFEPVMS